MTVHRQHLGCHFACADPAGTKGIEDRVLSEGRSRDVDQSETGRWFPESRLLVPVPRFPELANGSRIPGTGGGPVNRGTDYFFRASEE